MRLYMNRQKYYTIEDRTDEADIMIYGVIGESWFEESVTARQLVADIRNLEKKHARINVRINSPGGSVFDGLAIFNALQESTAQVHTWNDGLAASMAAVILMAGKTVHAAKNSLMMLHAPSTGVWGNARDITEAVTTLKKVENALIECMMVRSKKTRQHLEADYFDYSDHWLSAEEALEEGFIDELTGAQNHITPKMTSLDYQELVARWGVLVPEEKQKGKLTSFIESLFNPTPPKENTKEVLPTEMDIKILQGALSLGDTATENDVLERIQKMANDLAAQTTAKENALKELSETRAALAQAEKELEDYRKKPGAASATVDAETDNLEGNDQAKSFPQALACCFQILKK